MIATESLFSPSSLHFQNISLQYGLSVWNEYSYSEIKSGLFLKMGTLNNSNLGLKKSCIFKGHAPTLRKEKPTTTQNQQATKTIIS